ncbi:ImmA/IrrE family metallo-endopeptidase [Muricoccus vinaceus]|uniref:ImmA/IrrE family metallo-endopeptidase n=1 Tax=Muricoccus vinaceus TaxID=424704 RepID=A0ABV6J451_9PROT
MIRQSPAEGILRSLGVTAPSDIDLEAIAFDMGVFRIKYRELDGCEARIVGMGKNAIITVDPRSPPRRQRFSIAHELGHWHHHHGKVLFCQSKDLRQCPGALGSEQTANRFASNLLLPGYLLNPLARTFPKLTIRAVKSVAETFDASMTATAIRLVETGHVPSMLVCHGPLGRRWFVRSPGVPERWFPCDTLDPEGYAIEVKNGKDQNMPRKIGADAWFDLRGADDFEVEEESFRTANGEILTILNLIADDMLEEREHSYRR